MDAYIIQTKFWRLFGGAFWFKDLEGNIVAYSKQKRFKLKEDIVLFTDASCTPPILKIQARPIIDIWDTYDVTATNTGET